MIKDMIAKGQWLLMLLLLCTITACTDNELVSPAQGVVDENGMVTLTLHPNVPGLKETRGIDYNGERIETLWLLAFGDDGYMMSRVQAEQNNDVTSSAGGKGRFTAKVPSSTRILHFLSNVNMDNFQDNEHVGRHENEVVAPLLSSSGSLVYWGRRTFASNDELAAFARNEQAAVLLYRNQAMLQYKLTGSAVPDLEKRSGLEVEGWMVCNQYAYGTVAPFDPSDIGQADPFRFDLGTNDFVTLLPEADRIKQRDDEDVAKASDVPGDPRYIFENINQADDQVYVVMKIRNIATNTSKYYKVMLVDDNKEPLPVIRNHRYTVSIAGINEAYGVDTAEAAHTATPVNNPWITIIDEVPEVINGATKLRIEGRTTVVYQQEGTQTIEFYYNGTTVPEVKWLSNEGVADDIQPSDVVWDRTTGRGTVSLHVHAPAQDLITYGTLQIKEAGGVLSRRVKVLTTEPFEFQTVWISSEIPLLEGERITILFDVPENFPEELLPIDVKLASDLIDVDPGMNATPLKIITEETKYSVPVYDYEAGAWEYQPVAPDWNYKYVYSAATHGHHRVTFYTMLTNLGGINAQDEFHIYMEGDDATTGQNLFLDCDLYFAFQKESNTSWRDRYRILLEEGEARTAFYTRNYPELEPITGQTISIPFTLGTLRNDHVDQTTSWQDVEPDTDISAANPVEVWVYYEPDGVEPTGNWAGRSAYDRYGNYYSVYTATAPECEVTFRTKRPDFDCHIVLSAKSTANYGDFMENDPTDSPALGVNTRGYRSASVAIRSGQPLEMQFRYSLNDTDYTECTNGGTVELPYGIGRNLYWKLSIPDEVRTSSLAESTVLLRTKYLEPVNDSGDGTWERTPDGWVHKLTSQDLRDPVLTYHFRTNHLGSEEQLVWAMGSNMGVVPWTVDVVNPDLQGHLSLPTGVVFQTSKPYIVLERASDGTRIGSFKLAEDDMKGKGETDYTLTLRGEYNLREAEKINVLFSPINSSNIYIYSGLLKDLMADGVRIELQKEQGQ